MKEPKPKESIDIAIFDGTLKLDCRNVDLDGLQRIRSLLDNIEPMLIEYNTKAAVYADDLIEQAAKLVENDPDGESQHGVSQVKLAAAIRKLKHKGVKQ